MKSAKEIGEIVKNLRGNSSLREFAKKCDVSHTAIDTIEKGIDFRTGKPVQPKLATLEKIAAACSVPLTHITGSTQDNKIQVSEYNARKFLLGDDASDENWEKVKEFVEFLKTYKPKKAHLEENKMINYEKFAIRFRIALRANELYFRQMEKEWKHRMPSMSARYVSVGLMEKISSSDISLFVDGRKEPTNEQVDMLANFLRVDCNWLSGNDVPYPDWFNNLPLSIHDKTELGIIQLGEVVGNTTTVYTAAQSEENHPDQYTQKSTEFSAELEDTPESDEPLT